ncbi:MAG TPA: lysophospholipid acyltransferase family protein [Candidatus Wunengus sp. YC61]|uniref:lysophospholipid acyltransferase family protein n=1 Tax=Candidatus Wunengus sp. YC61 TaxID=3367698 RepID=UPI00402583D5
MSCVIWVAGSVITVFICLSIFFWAVILYPFDKMRKVAHAHSFLWADLLIALNPYWDIEISGLKNIDKTKTYVMVANHQSFTDIILLYKTKMQFKWVANEHLFKLPFVGLAMTTAKHIKLRKGKLGSIKNAYQEASAWLRRGMSIMLFPEGTRSNGYGLKEFQNGAFKLAIKEQVPILPISIKGTGNAIPRGSWLFTTKIPASMRVLEPVDTIGYTQDDFEKIRDLVRSRIEVA